MRKSTATRSASHAIALAALCALASGCGSELEADCDATDLVVLNRDPFEADRYEIQAVAPTAVMLAGKLAQGSLP